MANSQQQAQQRANEKLAKISVRVAPNPEYQARKPAGFTVKLEAVFVRFQPYLWVVHGGMFVFFLALMVIPPLLPEPMQNATIFNNFTELALFLVWGLWFPLVFLSVIFSGRSWCGLLCPMGAASEWANKKGLKRAIPAWLRWEGTPVISFIIVTILGQTLDVRDQPLGMAEIFSLTLVVALLVGFLYGNRKRAWCRHVCPIGLLLGVFSRLGMVQFAPKNKYKQSAGDSYTEKGVCPTMIAVSHKQESRHCIECFRCVKPESPGGLFVRLRKPGEEIEKIKQHNPNAAEVWFLFLSTGIALGGFLWLILPSYDVIRQQLASYFILHGWYWIASPGPDWLMSVHPAQRQVFNWLDFTTIVGYMLTWMVVSLLVLTLCNTVATFISLRFSKDHFWQRFYELGYQYAPIAMLSIIISLSGLLFGFIHSEGVSNSLLNHVKLLLLAISVGWSIYLGYKILRSQQLAVTGTVLSLLPSTVAILLIATAWMPAMGITW